MVGQMANYMTSQPAIMVSFRRASPGVSNQKIVKLHVLNSGCMAAS